MAMDAQGLQAVPADAVVRGLIARGNLTVSVVVCTQAAREGARRHQLHPVSATLLAQATAGALLLASLQKGEARLNLQLEVDGPLRGLFVDAGGNGDVRGYAKNPWLDVELGQGPFRWRAALGNSGFLSVLREQGNGEYYRSSVELKHFDLAQDLGEYFRASDQVATAVALEVVPLPGQPLGLVAGALLQCLPQGDPAVLAEIAAWLPGKLRAALEAHPALDATQLLALLFPQDCEAMATVPVRWQCSCSRERALATVGSLGRDDVQHLLDTLGSTAVTCQFCATRHEVTTRDLYDLLAALDAAARKAREQLS